MGHLKRERRTGVPDELLEITMNCRCGRLHITKRKKGPLAGLFVCPACGMIAGPRPLWEAMRRGIPLELWAKIHNEIIDASAKTLVEQQAIETKMIEEWRSGIN